MNISQHAPFPTIIPHDGRVRMSCGSSKVKTAGTVDCYWQRIDGKEPMLYLWGSHSVWTADKNEETHWITAPVFYGSARCAESILPSSAPKHAWYHPGSVTFSLFNLSWYAEEEYILSFFLFPFGMIISMPVWEVTCILLPDICHWPLGLLLRMCDVSMLLLLVLAYTWCPVLAIFVFF